MNKSKLFLTSIVAFILAFSLIGCAVSSTPPDTSQQGESSGPSPNEPLYKAIHDEYSKRLLDLTPSLIEAYKSEAEDFKVNYVPEEPQEPEVDENGEYIEGEEVIVDPAGGIDAKMIEGLSEISNAKIAELSQISNEGMTAMAQIMYTNGTSNEPEAFAEYESWAGKLQDIYIDESSKITDAYLQSVS